MILRHGHTYTSLPNPGRGSHLPPEARQAEATVSAPWQLGDLPLPCPGFGG